MIYNSIVETIGNTPMVRLNRIAKGIPGTMLAKVEYFNPGNSTKDRMAIKMVEDAEKAGLDGLKGHRSVGGMRASIYNAFPEAGVDALTGFMKEFERRHG